MAFDSFAEFLAMGTSWSLCLVCLWPELCHHFMECSTAMADSSALAERAIGSTEA
jgi:hypothetical protein